MKGGRGESKIEKKAAQCLVALPEKTTRRNQTVWLQQPELAPHNLGKQE